MTTDIDFLDFWAKLNLALDDIGLPEMGFLAAMTAYKTAEFTDGDFDKAIEEEVNASRDTAQAAVAEFLAGGCRS
jgi:hypothetical protein